ncbi:outer membrane transport energization protein TonB [Pricia antarctica]|uniref:Outer membrane transport energization protein TonB n=1 Tax=Pricia antarctica TaxID=641691 RepID=A0A1G7GWI9_9FLAO|nr:energy transducer TonB [Pricia antarctica]SDE92522.1 outer membrane transport energization protein TonB [Pricia antarctica]
MPYLDTRHKKKSFTLTTFLLSVLLLILFYIGMTYMDPPIENGISVNFGTTDFGSGNVQPKEKIQSEPLDTPPVEPVEQEEEVVEEIVEEEVVEEEAPEKVVAEEAPAEKVLTQENEEAIKIKKAEEAKKKAEDAQKAAKKKAEDAEKKKKAEAARVAQQKKDAEEKARKEQDAKKKKLDELMGGLNKSDGTASGSEGDDNRAGDKGSPDGDPYATSYYGSPGSGSGTGGYGLNGRSLASKGAVKQECNEEGRVVVKIVVDRNGNVVSAQPGVKGTTNNSPCLLDPAKKTAFKHKWNQDSNAPSQQVGFVVVNFKLGE